MFALIEQTEPQGNLHITKGFHFLVLIITQWLTRDLYLCEAGSEMTIAWSLLIQEKALTPHVCWSIAMLLGYWQESSGRQMFV